jgi:hypothetical protein
MLAAHTASGADTPFQAESSAAAMMMAQRLSARATTVSGTMLRSDAVDVVYGTMVSAYLPSPAR